MVERGNSYQTLDNNKPRRFEARMPRPDKKNEAEPIQLDKLSNASREVLKFAKEEARRLNNDWIGTEHILLGLIKNQDVAEVLEDFGIESVKIRNTVEFFISRGDEEIRGEIVLTPRSEEIIRLAFNESRRVDSPEITPQHILVGVLREGTGMAAATLESMGVRLDRIRSSQLREEYKDLKQKRALTYRLGQFFEDPTIDKSTKDRIQTELVRLMDTTKDVENQPSE